MPKDAAMSVRLPAELVARLARAARRKGVPKSALVERFLDEALRMEAHPGVIFRTGPAGRRAALRCGPDVWEVISTIKMNDGSVAAAAEGLTVHETQVRVALRYYGDYTEEIEDWIRTNDEEAVRAEAAWRRQRAIARD